MAPTPLRLFRPFLARILKWANERLAGSHPHCSMHAPQMPSACSFRAAGHQLLIPTSLSRLGYRGSWDPRAPSLPARHHLRQVHGLHKVSSGV